MDVIPLGLILSSFPVHGVIHELVKIILHVVAVLDAHLPIRHDGRLHPCRLLELDYAMHLRQPHTVV